MSSKVKALLAAFGVALLAGSGSAQHTNGVALTPQDYADIQHLYARYAHGIDSRDAGGALYASVFTSDAAFRNQHDAEPVVKGLQALTARYGVTPDGKPRPVGISHQTWNVVIDAAPWGATGMAYMGNGMYYDTLVKTAQGWRFTHRVYRQDFADDSELSQQRPAATTTSSR